MADLNRVVAGIRCIEVLGLLSEYLDGEVSPEDRARIEEHLLGCDQCERFGGRMSSIVSALRTALKEPEPLDDGVSRRLLERLNREFGLA